ncbi:unnamed protein product [Rotaria sordida]|uniref:U-box domain-containing protein n=1 Tax=Rotaria sordida TaxID=392033 RepID=A0A813S4M3_9BILA|nr:unnamed protein product [Rotaria sordida]CAF0792155.1 unnamed protein product [Rotaria sordida]CAF0889130.1 unnamed protein product [Rotaria sordida]CAF0907182.1 unnamed protein product [Rotaria sordida]CAF3710742.1 unnamed protein product [Rotaria sordida]
MENEVAQDEEVDYADIFCPITREIYRDPVGAADGFVYERDAITKWILQTGTSPFTRQPLKIDELKPDNKRRLLVHRRRQLTVSYDACNSTISLSSLRQVPTPVDQVDPITTSDRTYRDRVKFKKHIFQIVLLIIAVSITIGPILGMAVGM